MNVIKIQPYKNGAHANQASSDVFTCPEGWAILPDEVGTPDTLPNYPFGDITVEDIDGVPTVTSWTPLPIPEPEEPEEPNPEPADRIAVLEAEVAALTGAVEKGLQL